MQYSRLIIEEKKKYHKMRNSIFVTREKRVHPQKDDKILTDWNGLMISAFSRAGIILNNEEYVEIAKNSADFILENLMSSDGGLNKSYKNGNSNIPAKKCDSCGIGCKYL